MLFFTVNQVLSQQNDIKSFLQKYEGATAELTLFTHITRYKT